MRRFLQKHRDKTAAALSILTVVLVLAFFVFGLRPVEPRNPIGGYTPLEPEVMAVSSGGDDTDESATCGSGSSTESDIQEEEQEDAPEEKEEIADPEGEGGGLDGITDSDTALNEEGNGNNASTTIIPIITDDEDPVFVTDLADHENPRSISFSELEDDTLEFFAYIDHRKPGMKLQVRLFNDVQPANGLLLTAEGRDYKAVLAQGRNTITLYMREGDQIYDKVSFTIIYMPDKADPENPDVGEHPPVITVYSNVTDPIKTAHYIFSVSAEDYHGRYLSYDHMIVTRDGKPFTASPTGVGTYEYDFYFDPPVSGDSYTTVITVLAWDDEGNSSYRSFDLTYEYIDEGDVIGQATINIDLTTIGLGLAYTGFTFDVEQGKPLSYYILDAMDYYGLTAEYSGTPDQRFYLSGISGGYLTYGAHVPDELWQKILDDDLECDRNRIERDRLAEHHLTQGSGWMYTIDGLTYPGRGVSEYYLDGHGNNVTLRFTLAYGKDIGAASNTGRLSTYCGIWINGGYEPRHSLDEGSVIKEATCTEDGEWARTCTVPNCGYHEVQVIPALGHDDHETSRVEPTETEDGYIEYTCSRCGATHRETLPMTGGSGEGGEGPGEGGSGSGSGDPGGGGSGSGDPGESGSGSGDPGESGSGSGSDGGDTGGSGSDPAPVILECKADLARERENEDEA